MPECAFCRKETWDGMFRGKKMCDRGKGLVCKSCWVNNSDEADKPRWADWFLRREQAYPSAFPDEKDI